MINRLAANYGLEVIETPVGFNHIADWMLRDDILIGGEESGGISFKGNIPEGDGVLMGLLLAEMVSASGKSLHMLVEELLDEVGPAHYSRLDQRLKRPIAKDALVERLNKQAPDAIAGVSVERVNTKDGIKYLLEDDSWLLIRPSGTEPVLRIYAESSDPDRVQALLDFGRQVAER